MFMLPMLIAQADDTIDPEAATAASAAVAGFVGIWIFIWIVIVIAALIGLILWIWAIIDVSKRQFENPQNKTTWLIVLIVGFVVGLSLIAAIIYLIAGRKQGTMPGQSGPTPPTGGPQT